HTPQLPSYLPLPPLPALPHLNSFPTRRSSDLAAERDEEERFDRELFDKMAELGLTGIPWPEEYGGIGSDYVSYVIAVEELSRVRSEEHTSELQSRFDLVCRLLLEEKKQRKSRL